MNRILVCSLALTLGTGAAKAQSLDDLNIQIHGYATQGFLYTTNNNMFTTSSSNGSPAWSEAVVNVGAQPMPKLHVGVQARYFLLGNYGNAITLDWAAADYKASDRFGVRVGKVKVPSGLLNETQDIDPSYMWSLLPQGIYPITSRNSTLAVNGGVVYGTLPLSSKAGKLEYRGWAGEESIGPNDGYWVSFKEEGLALTNGLNAATWGSALHWKAPLRGFMLGSSVTALNRSKSPFVDTYVVPAGPSQGVTITMNGSMNFPQTYSYSFFGRYEKDRFMLAVERERISGILTLVGLSPVPDRYDQRPWYVMSSYKLTDKLTAGAYDSQSINKQSAMVPARYTKDWAVSGRYDFNQFLYAKAEQHFIDGTAAGYDANLNPRGIKPATRLTALKMGVSS